MSYLCVANSGQKIRNWIIRIGHCQISFGVVLETRGQSTPRAPRACPDFYVYAPGGTRLAINYQLAFTTPGISPLSARMRKQIRHISNLRKNARLRPQIGQRLYWRTLYLFFFCDFSTSALRAKASPY